MTTKTKSESDVGWERVREAITLRWPHITTQELNQCGNDVEGLTKFVQGRVKTGVDEVEAVVREFAPIDQSLLERMSESVTHQADEVVNAARIAYRKTDECISENPTQSVLTSFVCGILLGSAVTAMWMRSRPEPPNLWERMRDRRWS